MILTRKGPGNMNFTSKMFHLSSFPHVSEEEGQHLIWHERAAPSCPNLLSHWGSTILPLHRTMYHPGFAHVWHGNFTPFICLHSVLSTEPFFHWLIKTWFSHQILEDNVRSLLSVSTTLVTWIHTRRIMPHLIHKTISASELSWSVLWPNSLPYTTPGT